MTADTVGRLKITLDDVEPGVLRHIEVLLSLRLDRLHLTIRAAMGWTNSYLYEIRAREIGWGIPDPDWSDGPLDARKARLINVLEVTGAKTLHYIYDFDDNWECTVRIEGLFDQIPGTVYPRLIEASGRCPPEDVGDPPGYEELLAAIADPSHERHAEMIEWTGFNSYDPTDVDFEAIDAELAALAKRWNRKPRTKTARPT